MMWRVQMIIVSFKEVSEIQGSSLEIGADPTLDQETSLNIQQLKWPSLNSLLRTQSHLSNLQQLKSSS